MAVESHKILPVIEKYLTGSVMEIGCGDECVVPHAFGVDGRDFPCVHFLTDSLYDLPKQINKVGSFDTVFSSHVLEHLPDSYRCVKEWSMFCKKGGYFILYLPCGSKYDNFENREHCHDTRYESFMLWFRRVFCGEALNFRGGQLLPPLFELIDDGTDYGENRYSFYCVAKKL